MFDVVASLLLFREARDLIVAEFVQSDISIGHVPQSQSNRFELWLDVIRLARIRGADPESPQCQTVPRPM